MDGTGIVRQWLSGHESTEMTDYEDGRSYGDENPESLISSSSISELAFGTGFSLYQNHILPAIDSVVEEVLIVTCFFARSQTLDGLNDTLRKLSAKGAQMNKTIRVRICFSSSSLFQKLFHTTSLKGRTYAPSEWQSTLGLPNPEELRGLDLEAKSIFVLPFSVMHPKFVILDRSKVLLQSCNISWEDWFEGCIQFSGPITEQFVHFWKGFWASDLDRDLVAVSPQCEIQENFSLTQTPNVLSVQDFDLKDTISIFLPSQHHRNPQFALPWQPFPLPPPTPLNSFLLTAFTNAKRNIFIQTPNLTSPPVISALLAALKRGVDVTIITSERLMVLEQLATAGTTTRCCVRTLVRSHRTLFRDNAHLDSAESGLAVTPGMLSVRFYSPVAREAETVSEPVQSHIKLTIVDGEITILGSGNMDRASWYTSQELGVAFISVRFAASVRTQVDGLMRQRTYQCTT